MVDSHCPYCALQCAMRLEPSDDGGLGSPVSLGSPSQTPPDGGPPVTVSGRDFPTNRGGLCQKGWTSARVLTVPDRITTPLVRAALLAELRASCNAPSSADRDLREDRGELVPATWHEALEIVVSHVLALQATHGPESIAVFGGGGLTNEKAYTLGKFARTVLRTPHIDYNGRFCMASAAAGANRSLGIDRGLPFPLEDLGGAQAVLLLGSNLAETMPPAVQHLAAAREAGGLVVVDPRRSLTADLAADGRGIHVQPVPGTDLAVLLGLLHVVLAEGLADTDYLASRTTGLEDVVRSVAAWWPERVELVSGVRPDELRRVARFLAAAAPAHGGTGAFVLTGRGVEQSRQGTATVTAAINLALALGLPGREGSGYGAITGQGNGQGGREHGQKADQLPGYRSITDPAARAHVAAVWGVDPDSLPGPGRPAVELLASLGTPGGPRALFVHGSNVLVSAPDAGAVARRLAALDLLVVSDFVPSETALAADVVLPVAQWAEEEGTMTSLEGRVIRRRKAIDPPGLARSELLILADLAARLRPDVEFATDPAVVFDELARASAGGRADYSGLSHARLDREPDLFWPCPASGPGEPEHPGTPRLFRDRFPTHDGRARLIPVDHVGPAEEPDPGAPIYLVTGRVLAQYQSGAQTRRVPELERTAPEPFVEVHPVLAERLRVDDGGFVRLRSKRGEATARARVTTTARPDTVFMPFHWGGTGSANLLTNDATDPISGMPEFKVCAVEVEAVAP